jgi:hypothetical protein
VKLLHIKKYNVYNKKSWKPYNKKLLIFYLLQQVKFLKFYKKKIIYIVMPNIYLKYFKPLFSYKNFIFFKKGYNLPNKVDLVLMLANTPKKQSLIRKYKYTPIFSLNKQKSIAPNYYLPFAINNIKTSTFFIHLLISALN